MDNVSVTATSSGSGSPGVSASGTVPGLFTAAGTASEPGSFTVSGSLLTNNLSVTAPTGLEVSTNNGTGYSSSLSLVPTTGTVISTPIFVRIGSSAPVGSISTNVTVASAGATDVLVPVSGSVNGPVAVPFGPQNFETNNLPFVVYSVAGNRDWSYVTNSTLGNGVTNAPANRAMEINGFGGDVPSNDWLILGPINASAASNPVILFNTLTRFTNNAVNELTLKISTNYPGTGNPTNSSWTTLGYNVPAANTITKTTSGQVVLTGAANRSNVYVAWHLLAGGTASGTTGLWQVDDVELLNASGPVITSFSPTNGWVGTNVVITGLNLGSTGTTQVSFNGTAATSLTVNPEGTQITVAVPAGATTGPISVVVGVQTNTSLSTFTMVDPNAPVLTVTGTLTNFSTTNGTASAAQTLSLAGTNLAGSVTVTGPTGIEMATTGAYANPLTIAAFGTLASTTVNVRIASSAAVGSITGNLSFASTNATARTVAVSGTVAGSGGGGGVLISQIYGAGGNTAATFNADYIELFNSSASAQSLVGWSLQYASATGTSWNVLNLNGTIQAGKYFLVGMSTGAIGSALPTPDQAGSLSLSGSAGKVALVNGTTALTGATPTGPIIDLVGYGTSASAFEGTGPAPGPSNNTDAIFRAGNGATDTGNNSTDFSVAPANPRNSAGGSGGSPSLTLSTSSISGLTTSINTVSAVTNYTVTGANLTSNVTVSLPANPVIEISTNNASGFGTNAITLTPTAGVVSNTIYLRIASNAVAATFTNAITHASAGAASRTVTVSGTVTAPVAKTITLASSLTNLVEGRDGNWSGAAPDDYTKYEAVLTITRTDTTSAVQVDLSSSSPNQVGVLNTNAPAVFPIVYSNLPTTVNFGVGVATQTFYLAPVNNTNGTGNRSVIVTASAASAGYTQGNFTYNIAEDDPYITNTNLTISGTVGTAISPYQVQATNNAVGYAAVGLPTGLSINPTTGLISGTPEVATNNAIAQVTASNLNGTASGSANLILNIAKGTPALVGTVAATAISEGQTLAASTITATNLTPSGGSWAWANASTVPPVGTNSYSAVYTPESSFQANWNNLTSNVSVVVNPAGSGPTLIAEDKADNYGGPGEPGWADNANAGYGFGAWNISTGTTTNGFAGNFTGDPSAAGITGFGTNAFGLFANPADNANFVAVKRAFSTSLAVGQTFSFQWALNWDTGGIGNKGFVIKAGGINGTTLVNVNQGDFPGDITLGGTNTGLASGNGPMTWAFRLVNSNTLQVSSSARNGTTNPVYTTNLTVSGAPDAFEFYVSGLSAVDGNNRQPYFNNLQIFSGGGGGTNSNTITFGGWSGGVTLTNTNLHLLTKYAIGGASSASANDGVANVVSQTSTNGTNYLVLRAFVRTNDSKLEVGGEAGASLAAGTQWTNPVLTNSFIPTGATPAGTTPREYRTVQDTNSKKFLRLKATLKP